MAKHNGILNKISRAFLLQGILIAIAAILGVFFAKIVIEEILVKSALLEEESFFWENYSANPDFPLPNIKNLTGFFNPDALPEELSKDLPVNPGFYDFEGDNHLVLYISEKESRVLYLVYYRGQVDALVLYYGLFPLLTVLVILYLSLWLTYRVNRKTVSPLIALADKINRINFDDKNLVFDIESSAFDTNDEIKILSDAIVELGDKLQSFISRERDFTRDASHELRSPLTVISIATDLLSSESDLSPASLKSISRIKRAIDDMGQLTEVFLMLAREDDQALEMNAVMVNNIIEKQIDHSRIVHRNKPVELTFDQNSSIKLWASDMVLSVLLGNLIRNAILYTERGSVSISTRGHKVYIKDSGAGMSPEQVSKMFKPYHRGHNQNASGFGVGLTIVKRLSERFNWPIIVTSSPGEGTQIEIQFPNAEVQPGGIHQEDRTN